MVAEKDSNEFYEKLKIQLYETSSWPSDYLFKFIIESDVNKINKLKNIFNDVGSKLIFSKSKNGKYTSVSINTLMNLPEDVISRYKEVSEKIDGVISL